MTITPESVEHLLASEQFSDRLSALNHLRQLEPAVAFRLIRPALTDANVRVRYAAVSQVATLGAQDRELALVLLRDRLIHDPEIDVKAAAADALSALKLQEAFGDLEQVYRGTNEWLLQFSIIAALGEMGHPDGFALLAEALGSQTELVQTAAITAIGELGDERAVPLLLPFVHHDDWQMRARTAQSLGNFKTSAPAQEALAKLAQDDMEAVAQAAQASLS
ncbi:MAG: HEAT repeat domain-containing protein [Synechococcales cyanobacterium RU_4_20]|nr:HEAT repeat domain-containing protein [Synechococcales cyanobacterium RU_4_20]